MDKKFNIYLRKDGRYEDRIPIGRWHNGTIRYRSLYVFDKKEQDRIRQIVEKGLLPIEKDLLIVE